MGATGIVAPMPSHLHTRAARAAVLLALPGALTLALAGAGCRRGPAPAVAAGDDKPTAAPARLVRLEAAAEPATVVPGGAVTMLWRLRPEAGWHLYWNGRNDSGFAPRQKLALPAGWQAGPLLWPVPARHVSAGDILDHVYEGELVLLQQLVAPTGAVPGSAAEVRADWEWLACRESCVPGRDSLVVRVTVGQAPAAAVAPPPSAALRAARARLPQDLPAGLLRTTWEGATLRVERAGPPVAGQGRLTFMPAGDCADLVDLLHDGQGAALALRVVPAEGRLGPVRGLVLVEDGAGPARSFTLDVPAVSSTGGPSSTNPTGG